MFSSELFLRGALVSMGATTIGRRGQERREGLLTQARGHRPLATLPMGQLRRRIKTGLVLTDQSIAQLTRIYLCGEPAPFTAAELVADVRQAAEQCPAPLTASGRSAGGSA